MIQTQQKKIIAITIIITLVGLIISLNIGDPIQPNASVFDTSNTNTTPSNEIRAFIFATMASPVAIKSSVSLSFSGSNGGRGLGKPGGKCGLVVN
jgi:fructose-specific phosphotransferase system IIC component